MKQETLSGIAVLFGGLIALFTALSAASADPVPQDRRIDWSFTGVAGGIPNRTNICATLNPGATAAAINSAIASCGSSGGGVVLLAAGAYNVTGIRVATDNVTLRGAGADQTILRGCNILNLGSGSNIASNVAITSGAGKGSTSFTVASVTGLSPNTMIEIARDDDPNVVVSTSGGSRHIRQLNVITAINGNSITVRNPLIWNFSTGTPKIKFTFINTRLSGVENLKLDHSGTSGCSNFNFQYCERCWLRGIHSHKPSGYHMTIVGTLNGEIRDSYVSDAQTYGSNNGGLAVYGSDQYGSNSSWKIENNIFDRVFPGIELQNSSSGFYIGYNYGFGTMASPSGAPVTWMFTDNHGPHDMMNLWEGNVGEMFGSDGYYGGSSHGTIVRNFFTGYNPNFGTKDDPVRLNRLSYDYNFVGNVLGSANEAPKKYVVNSDGCTGGPAIYRLGFPNIGNCGLADSTGLPVPGGMTYPDAKVASTLLRWGNYDYFNKVTRWDPSEIPSGIAVPADTSIPRSYYYASRPSWWKASVPWPPIGPDVTGGNGDASGHVNKIPAQLCWETRNLGGGGSFNAASCYATVGIPPPTNFRVLQ
jgi:hypothetical protein